MKRIILIRHGESIANTRGIYQGQTYDTPLTPKGQLQASQTASFLSGDQIDRVVASPLIRTRDTARLIAHAQSLPVSLENKLLETNHGSWEGREQETIRSRWPEIYRTWITAPSLAVFPRGESFVQTQERVLDWFREAIGLSGTTVAVTHDNVIRIIIAHTLSLHLDTMWNFHLHPCSISTIEVHQSPKLVCLNDTHHLVGSFSDVTTHAL